MDKLWAPWRLAYVTGLNRKKSGCIFCKIYRSKNDRSNFVFLRGRHSYAVLNIFPYNNGHAMLVPNRHVKDISTLSREEREDLFDLLDDARKLLDKTLKPQGYNIGINLGRIAGGGIPGHLHVHVVPRWKGDVNFMPVTAGTGVISQSLNALFRKLSDANGKKR